MPSLKEVGQVLLLAKDRDDDGERLGFDHLFSLLNGAVILIASDRLIVGGDGNSRQGIAGFVLRVPHMRATNAVHSLTLSQRGHYDLCITRKQRLLLLCPLQSLSLNTPEPVTRLRK